MIKTNSEYLKELQAEWYEALLPKDRSNLTKEQLDKTEKNSKRNARRTLHSILKDRVAQLENMSTVVDVDPELKQAKENLAEFETFRKPINHIWI